jgi:hypothetical protein
MMGKAKMARLLRMSNAASNVQKAVFGVVSHISAESGKICLHRLTMSMQCP